jgi:glycolate oxidase FAD binding subunit
MTDTLKPRDGKDIEDTVRWAIAEGKALEIVGHGSKRGIGRPAQTDLTLDLSALSGVTLYEPEELVLTARAGTPIAEIEALVESKGQQLAFEPMDYGPLFGRPAGRGTIGGVLAANVSGPRRIKAGAARDHFLGFSAVSGRGETFKSGGRVVKNVTGYDLCKLMAGSWGTLAALTEVTIKTLPRPETEATVLVLALHAGTASKAMTAAMGSSCDVSGAALMPANVALLTSSDLPRGASVTALRLEGVAPSVEHRRRALEALLQPFGTIAALDQAASRAVWRGIRDVVALVATDLDERGALWRISLPPTEFPQFAARIPEAVRTRILADWAGGLLWLRVMQRGETLAPFVREAVRAVGGHATLIEAVTALRAVTDVFEPQDAGLAALTKRVKEGFDPKGVLNPGRMWAGV